MVLFTNVQDTFVHSVPIASISIRDRITSCGTSTRNSILLLQKLLTDFLVLDMYVCITQTKTKTTLNSWTYWHNALRVGAVDSEEGYIVENTDQSALCRGGNACGAMMVLSATTVL